MAKFKPGQSGNPGGRPKGSSNKTAEQIREAYRKIVSERIDSLQDDLDKMSPTNRWNILLGIQRTFLPNLNKTDLEGVVNGDINIKVLFVDDNKKEEE